MIKTGRIIVYSIVLGTAAWAAILVFQPPSATSRKSPRHRIAAAVRDDSITDANLGARFPRYSARGGDAFAPKVVPKKLSASGGPLNVVAGEGGSWALTGITVLDGLRSAVMENGTTHDIVFLKSGDRWNGLRVASVDSESVLLLNALNQPTRVAFAEPTAAEAPTALNTTAGTTGSGVVAPAPIELPGRWPAATSRTSRDESVNMR